MSSFLAVHCYATHKVDSCGVKWAGKAQYVLGILLMTILNFDL